MQSLENKIAGRLVDLSTACAAADRLAFAMADAGRATRRLVGLSRLVLVAAPGAFGGDRRRELVAKSTCRLCGEAIPRGRAGRACKVCRSREAIEAANAAG